jgi:hypothetical protein
MEAAKAQSTMAAVDEVIGAHCATLPKNNPTLEKAVLQIVEKRERKNAKHRVKFATPINNTDKKRKGFELAHQDPSSATKKSRKKKKKQANPAVPPSPAAIKGVKGRVGQKQPPAKDQQGTVRETNNADTGQLNAPTPKALKASKKKAIKKKKNPYKWKRPKKD